MSGLLRSTLAPQLADDCSFYRPYLFLGKPSQTEAIAYQGQRKVLYPECRRAKSKKACRPSRDVRCNARLQKFPDTWALDQQTAWFASSGSASGQSQQN